jgi:GxxExxY protein
MEVNEIVEAVMDSAFEVHRALGPGLYESAYKRCLCHEMAKRGLRFEQEHVVPLVYRGQAIGPGYRMDLLVEGKVVVEVKAVAQLSSLHTAQILTYLRLGKYPAGLLFNFNTALLKDGIKRLVWNYNGPRPSIQEPAPT